jgi:hypothetical protein
MRLFGLSPRKNDAKKKAKTSQTMIYVILSIPFLFAAIYHWASWMTSKCFTQLMEDGQPVLHNGEPLFSFDSERAEKYINIMILCYYPAWPALQLGRLFK